MMTHKWISWNDECEACGSADCDVFTVSRDGAYDGDDVRCNSCGQTGYVSADDGDCYTVWQQNIPRPIYSQEDA